MADSPQQPQRPSPEDPFATSVTMLRHAREGSSTAWQELVDKYRPWIQRQCLRSGLSREDAENISQEVFIELFTRISNFERSRQGSFRRWLALISRSRMVDFLRAFSRRKEELADPQQMSQVTQAGRLLDDEQIVPSAQTLDRFDATMERMRQEFSDRDIEILVQLLTGDRSPKDIARELKISTNAVYLVKSRMIKYIRKVAEEVEEDEQE